MSKTSKDAEINHNLAGRLQEIARMLDMSIQEACNEHIPFLLLVFGPGRAHFVSGVDRDSLITGLDELRASLEAQRNGQDVH